MPLRALVTSQLKKNPNKITNFSSYFQTQDILHTFGSPSCFCHVAMLLFFFSLLRKVPLLLPPDVLEVIDSESVIHRGWGVGGGGCYVILPSTRGPAVFTVIPGKKAKRTTSSAQKSGPYCRILKADWSWQLLLSFFFGQLCFPPNVPAISSHSCRLTMFNFT